MRNSINAMVFGSLLAAMVISTGAVAQVQDNATVVIKKTVVRGDDRTAVVGKNVVRHRDGDVVRRGTVVHQRHHDRPVRVHGVWIDAPVVRVRVNDRDSYRIYRHHNRPYYYKNGIRVYYRDHDRRDRHHRYNDRNDRIQNRDRNR